MKRVVLVSMLLLWSCNTSADVNKIKEFETVKNFLNKARVDISEVKDIGSLYEVVVIQGKTKNIIYVTKDGKYVVIGNLLDKNANNVTRDRAMEINKIDFQTIPFNEAIEIKKGNGEKRLVMVTDVNCPYCRKAYEWLKTKDNYTLYIFFMPLSDASYQKTVKILCAKDIRSELSLAKEGKEPTSNKCDAGETRLKKNIEFAQSIGVTGTPLFIKQDGRRIEGFAQQNLEEYLGK